MKHYDPWSNTQVRFHRTDPTGRWVALHTERRQFIDDVKSSVFIAVIAATVVVGYMLAIGELP